MVERHVGGVIVLPDPGFLAHRDCIGRPIALAGRLLSLGSDLNGLYRQAARFVDKILREVRPGDSTVEPSTNLEDIINLKTAKAFELSIPRSLVERADEIIP